MSKQTAVEWLVKELNQKINFIPMDKWDEIKNIVQQAKEMEKEQHKMTFNEALDEHSNRWFEQYYNQTFKKITK